MTAPITWAEATSPIYWSNIGINWNSPAKGESPSFAVDAGYTTGGTLDIGSSASYGVDVGDTKSGRLDAVAAASYAVDSGYTSLGTIQIPASVSFANDMGYTALGLLNTAFASATYGIQNDYSGEARLDAVGAVTFALQSLMTSDNEFLWNGITDPSTTWSAVSDPTTIWSDVNDPTTTWTKIDYPH